MAYSALVSLSQILYQVTDGNEHQIKTLLEQTIFLQAFLDDYASLNGEKVDQLEGRIRAAAYQAADIIELYISNQVASLDSSGFQYLHGRELKWRCHDNMWEVIKEIDSIVEEAKERRRSCRIEDPAPSRSIGDGLSGQAPSYGTAVVGFDEDLVKLKARLCGETDELRIISIVGMGGVGKTTLAKTIFDDSLILYHFDFRAWITISQEYCMRDILLGLLSDAMHKDLSKESDGVLAENVYKSLKGRRYIIIMDDMWSTEAWDDVRRILPNDRNGSRVVITSRLLEVGTYADSCSPPHQVQLLNGDQSWSLLKQKVFANESCPPELGRIGKIIAVKCGGLPLAVVLVAGLLSKVDTTLNHWEKFELNVSSTLATSDESLFKIFSLSYKNLPHHLRACFLYMGGFPEDSEIPISKLTKLWTAEGFLKPVRTKSLEEVAEECVRDLVKRNLVSITSFNGRSKFCSIHDLLRDFCIRKAHDENFFHVKRAGSTSQEGIENERRICILVDQSESAKASGLLIRSVLINKYKHYSLSYATNYWLLRVLDGSKIYLGKFPTEVTELFHLRYLAFSQFSAPFAIPTSILKLQNLQTLIITSDYLTFHRPHELEHKISLPYEIWKMPKLRHLILHTYCHLPVPFHWFPAGKTHVLHNLQTLSRVINFSFTKETIEMVPNLKKLGVVYYREVVYPLMSTSFFNNLSCLHQLESLNLCFPSSSLSAKNRLQSYFAQSFALPPKLKKLTLTGCGLHWQDLSIVGRLPNLEVLKLREESVIGKEWASIEGEFLQLKFLLMERLDIACWGTEYTHFPSLEHLIVRNCWKLEEIPSEIGEIPTLQSIEVVNVAESAGDSVIQIQEEQQSLGNNSLRIYVACRRG